MVGFRLGTIGYIIIAFIVLIIIGLRKSSQDAKRVAKKTGNLLQALDHKYNDYIQKRINVSIMKSDNFDFDRSKIIEEALLVIKPDIEALIASVNASSSRDVNIEYVSSGFPTINSIIEQKFFASANRSDKKMNEMEEQEVYEAFSDAIAADVESRMVSLKAGDI